MFVIFFWDIFISRFYHEDLRALNYLLDAQKGPGFGCVCFWPIRLLVIVRGAIFKSCSNHSEDAEVARSSETLPAWFE